MFGIDDALIGLGIGLVGSWFEADAKKDANAKAQLFQQQQLAMQKENLMLQKHQLELGNKRYEQWYNIYGTLQESLGDYYKNLKGSDLSTIEMQKIQEATQKAKDKVATEFAQRGLDGSGLLASTEANLTYRGELAKAMSEATADDRARQQQAQFLSLGINQGNAIANSNAMIAGSLNSAINSMGNTYNNMGKLAINNGQATVDWIKDLSFGMGSYIRHKNPLGGTGVTTPNAGNGGMSGEAYNPMAGCNSATGNCNINEGGY